MSGRPRHRRFPVASLRNGPELLDALAGAGLTGARAERFLSAAGLAVQRAIEARVADLDLSWLDGPSNRSKLLARIDPAALARSSGATSAEAARGIAALLPPLLRAIQANWRAAADPRSGRARRDATTGSRTAS